MKYLECLKCKKPALKIVGPEALKPGRPLMPQDYQHMDGKPIQTAAPILCDSCGHALIAYGQKKTEGGIILGDGLVHNNFIPAQIRGV